LRDVSELRLKAALLAAYPTIETWEDQDAIDYAAIRMEEVLGAADAVLFAEESVSRAYPYVYGFLKRRGMVPVGKEVASLVGYVVGALEGKYDVE
jgi:hypothetical protein